MKTYQFADIDSLKRWDV